MIRNWRTNVVKGSVGQCKRRALLSFSACLFLMGGSTLWLRHSSSSVHAWDDAPPWLRAAASLNLPTFPKDVPAAVLTDDSVVTIDDDGRMVRTDTYAVKVLTREGRGES